MLHYNPQHVSSSTLLILRRINCIITASGIVTLCKRSYSMPVESGLQSALNRHTVRQKECIKLATWTKCVLLLIQNIQHVIIWRVISNKCKGSDSGLLRYYADNCQDGLKKTKKSFSRDRQFRGRDPNRAPRGISHRCYCLSDLERAVEHNAVIFSKRNYIGFFDSRREPNRQLTTRSRDAKTRLWRRQIKLIRVT